MSEHDELSVPPTFNEVADRLRRLINGELDRESIAEWAGHWVALEDPPISNPKVWLAVERLSGADMFTTDRPYLYGREDFESWLAELLD